MVCVNELRKEKCHSAAVLEPLLRTLAPFAPHITEELWHHFENTSGSIHHMEAPQFDESLLAESSIVYPVSINGKKRGEQSFPADASRDDIIASTLDLEFVRKWTEGKEVKKVIVVPNRMINVVV